MLAAVKDPVTVCQIKVTQYEEPKKAHDAEIQQALEATFALQTTTSYFSKIHKTGSTHTVDRAEIPSLIVKRPCRHCTELISVVPEAELPIISTTKIRISDPDELYAQHEDELIQLWTVILKTKKLRLGCIVDSAMREQWIRFPLCSIR